VPTHSILLVVVSTCHVSPVASFTATASVVVALSLSGAEAHEKQTDERIKNEKIVDFINAYLNCMSAM
jgi:hypothetical protein